MSTLPTESDHRMRDGTVHPVQVGLRLVEELRMRCKDSVEEDPLEAVAVIYERELTKIKASLEGGALEEFNALCPTLSSLSPSLYRYNIVIIIIITTNLFITSWRSSVIPPTPETQVEIDLDTRCSPSFKLHTSVD